MTDAELDEYRTITNAQMAAMRTVLLALIDTHPDLPGLSAQMTKRGEMLTAQWLNSALPDQFVAEFQKQMAGFQSRAQSAAKAPKHS